MNFNWFIICISLLISGYYCFNPKRSQTIAGGRNAKDGSAPFLCSLQKKGKPHCGCVILSSKWIVTAAHCVMDKDFDVIVNILPKNLQVVVGTNDLKSRGQNYTVRSPIKYEKFKYKESYYDIAMVEVREEIEFNEKVQPIQLSAEEIPEGTIVQFYGWGDSNNYDSEHVQVIDTTITRCGSLNHESHLCTINKKGEGPCDGDSGGPLIFNNKLIAVANWGECGSGLPIAYAKVSYFYNWINDFIESTD